MANNKETFKGNGAATQAVLESGALMAGTLLGAALIDQKTPVNVSEKAVSITAMALATVGLVHGFMKGAEAQKQFSEQNSLIGEAVHKGYIEESIERVSHKVR